MAGVNRGEPSRIPLVVDLDVEGFTDAMLSEKGSYVRNAIADTYRDGTQYMTQRPAITILNDASDTVAKVNGRGIYYWAENDTVYVVNDDTVYRGEYTSVGTITSGSDRVEFGELAGGTPRLILVDAQNNEAWTINSSHTLTQITDTDFPSEQTPALNLAHGCPILDTYAFVGTAEGKIYQSDPDDPTSWNALDFLEAEREPDSIVYLGKHHDNIVALGSKTIEFFYNAANTTGSVLQRREDVFYKIGCIDGQSVWENEDIIYFLGTEETGSVGLYMINNFQISKVSKSTHDRLLSTMKIELGYASVLCGLHVGGHEYITCHFYSEFTTPHTDVITLVYDASTSLWSEWTTSIAGLSKFPAFGATVRTTNTSTSGRSIMRNGDLYKPIYGFTAQDNKEAIEPYVDADYVAEDYISSSLESNTSNIDVVIRTNNVDFSTLINKFQHRLELIADYTDGTATIRWTDDDYNTYISPRTITLSRRDKLTRGGVFNRRAFELSYSGQHFQRFEALELILGVGHV